MQKNPATLIKNNKNKTDLSGFLHHNSQILDLNFIFRKLAKVFIDHDHKSFSQNVSNLLITNNFKSVNNNTIQNFCKAAPV